MSAKHKLSKNEGVVVIIGVVLLATLVTVYLYMLGIPKEILFFLVTGIFTFSAAALPKVLEQKTPLDRNVNRATLESYRNPVLSALLGFFLLLFSVASVALYNGTVFFVVSGYFEGQTDEQRMLIATEVGFFTNLITIPATVAISIFVSHRIRKGALYWVLGIVLLYKTTTIIVAFQLMGSIDRDLVVTTLAGWIPHLVAAGIGYGLAKKTQNAYVIRRQFGRLSKSEQQKFLGIISANPNKWQLSRRPNRK
jgi:hypothetical protein